MFAVHTAKTILLQEVSGTHTVNLCNYFAGSFWHTINFKSNVTLCTKFAIHAIKTLILLQEVSGTHTVILLQEVSGTLLILKVM